MVPALWNKYLHQPRQTYFEQFLKFMVEIELRYIPALRSLLPVPSLDRCIAAVRRLGRTGGVRFSSDTFRLKFSRIEEAAEFCSDVWEGSKPRGLSITLPEMFPFQAIAWAKRPPSPEMWRLAPPGHMLVPAELDFAGASQWLYEWEIWSMSGENAVMDRLTPLRSLLVTGSLPGECFFCGSRNHASDCCTAMWTGPVATFTTGRLSEINPALWLEYMQKAGGREHDIISALDYLQQDLRRAFTWNFAARLCRSSAAHFSEFAASPLKSIEVYELKSLFEAISKGSMEQIGTAIRCSRGKNDTSALSIMKGFYAVAMGEASLAMEKWWDAEREAGSPMRKCYAALLQSRLFFMTGDFHRAAAAVNRAGEADPCPAVTYWSTIFCALGGNRTGVMAGIQNMASAPRLISAALAEPLLLRYQVEIEDTFKQLWKKQETLALEHVKQIESVLQQAQGAFGTEVVKESAIRLRDWRGRWPRMGYRTLLSSEEFLDGLKNQVMQEVNRRFRETLSKFPAYENRCRTILSRLPHRASTRKIRKACLEVIRDLREAAASGRAKDLDKLKGFREEVGSLMERYKEVNRMYQNYIDKVWQKRVIIKCMIYGTCIAIIVWLAFYMYELLNP